MDADTQLESVMDHTAAVNAIARILANVDRKRLGYQSIVQLDDLEAVDASYYREQAAMAIYSCVRGNGDDGRFFKPQNAHEFIMDNAKPDYKYKALYFELLYEVEAKCPNESRHETALRYIKQAETPSGSASSVHCPAHPTEKETP